MNMFNRCFTTAIVNFNIMKLNKLIVCHKYSNEKSYYIKIQTILNITNRLKLYIYV